MSHSSASVSKNIALAGTPAPGKPASRAEKTFRQLLGQIERKRAELAEWQEYRHRYAGRIAAEFEPLQAQVHSKQRELAILIGELLLQGKKALKRGHRALLRELLALLLESVPPAGPDDPILELRERYTDAGSREPPEDGETPEGWQEEPGEPARKPSGQEGGHRTAGPREPAAAAPAPSLRAVFRRLVSALHPDREPDPAERARKNELMQRVNQAYETRDLVTLLALQREEIDADPALSPDLLAQHNQTLRAQLQQLQSEVQRIASAFRALIGDGRVSVAAVDRTLTLELDNLRAALKQLTQDLVRFRDPAQLRASLDALARQRFEEEAAEELLAEAEQAFMDDILAAMAPPRRRRRRRR
jgi:hypothetical protein